jgi:hypothetical protein
MGVKPGHCWRVTPNQPTRGCSQAAENGGDHQFMPLLRSLVVRAARGAMNMALLTELFALPLPFVVGEMSLRSSLQQLSGIPPAAAPSYGGLAGMRCFRDGSGGRSPLALLLRQEHYGGQAERPPATICQPSRRRSELWRAKAGLRTGTMANGKWQMAAGSWPPRMLALSTKDELESPYVVSYDS